jgi:acetylornithine deacetylase/succinyl-diaminopimelate desuccinylase-like protein
MPIASARPFDTDAILDGICCWVEIGTPTDAPDRVNKLAGSGSGGNFTEPFTATLDGLGVDGEGAHTRYEQMYISSIEPRTRLLYRLYQTLR